MDVAVVGGGFCGVMVAVHLLERAPSVETPPHTPWTVHVFEQRSTLAEGVAYSTRHLFHRLNVRAEAMGCSPFEPEGFARWLQARAQRGPLAGMSSLPENLKTLSKQFAPRALYPTYLLDALEQATGRGQSRGHRLRLHLATEVVGLKRLAPKWQVEARAAPGLCVDRVVLATGHLPDQPQPPWAKDLPEIYIADPWRDPWTESLDPEAPVLLWGSGLTMADQALVLLERGHRGPIQALSRRGQGPKSHPEWIPATNPVAPRPYPAAGPSEQTALGLCQALRAAIGAPKSRRQRPLGVKPPPWAQAPEPDVLAAIDGLRPHTPEIWRALPPRQRQRLMRHASALWDSHRHRLAPESARRLTAASASQQLQLWAGRLVTVEPCAPPAQTQAQHQALAHVRRRGQSQMETFVCSRVVNCTGRLLDYRRTQAPLWQQLVHSGLAQADPLGLGLALSPSGALLDEQQRPSSELFALGTVATGRDWESTAVPELRQQAWAVAEKLLSDQTLYQG